MAFALAFFASFIVIFFISVIQLNILSITLNLNKEAIGLISSREEIVKILKKNNRPPEIIAIDKNPHKELLAIAAATTGITNYYGGTMLQSIPSYLVIPMKKQKSGILLLDNTLIVSEINPYDIHAISPVVGYLLVKHYFPLRKIKAYPKIAIMGIDKYKEFRKKENIQKIAKIDIELEIIKDKISSLSANIESDKKLLSEIQDPKNVKDKKEINIDELTAKIDKDLVVLSENKYSENFYKSQKQLLQQLTKDSPDEQGLFIPIDTIRIVYKTNNSRSIADYFATLTHEYLHYSSYISKSKMLNDSFFEEGLTEYFARSAIKNDLNTSTNLGYPVQAKIIGEMTNIIPESELAEIYFTKDQEGLERALNRVYGDDFHKETRLIFETLQYASNPNEILKLANNIMKRIGGKPLTHEDLISTYSQL